MEAVRALAQEIGPRPPCSDNEERAARWCTARFQALGIEAQMERFASRPSATPWICAYLAAAGLGAALLVPFPLIGFVLGVGALVLYARDVDGRPLVGVTGGSSANVVARRKARVAPSLVVVAGLDSGRASPRFNPSFPPGPRGWAIVVHGALVLVPVVTAVAWVAESTRPLPPELWIASAALTAALLGAALAELRTEQRVPPLDGANDNASGVEILLRVAARFPDSDVWWVLTGSSHAGHAGMQAFLEAHASELGEARILNVVGVGGGRLTAPGDEGLLRLRRADGALMDAAVEAGADTRSFRAVQSAAAVAIANRRPALSIVGLDDRGSIPRQGWVNDVPAHLDEGCIDRAADLVARVVEVSTGHTDGARRGRPFVDGPG